MTRRERGDSVDAMRSAPPLPLWEQPEPSNVFTRWASLTELEREAQRERWCELLTPITIELATAATHEGITASDVISHGITRGVLNGERSFLKLHPRIYSFVGHFLAGLARDGILAPKMLALANGGEIQAGRKSERAVSKGNFGKVYVLPQFGRRRIGEAA